MPSKYELMSQVAAQKAKEITSAAERYMEFLETAAANYKYTFREQLLIYAQKPDATACAEIGTWNRLGRWVNKGTKGIALLVEAPDRYRLRYVFDVSDTNSRQGRTVTLWGLQQRYEDSVIEALENSFGALDEKQGFVTSLVRITENIVEDNFTDYAEMLRSVKAGSLLEELDDQSLEVWLKSTVKSGVAFMALSRCGYDARQYFDADDFPHLYDFNTYETISVLGGASSDMAEMALREIEGTVKALQKAEREGNRTFANSREAGNNGRKTNERSDEHGTDLSTGGRLSSAQRDRAGEPEDWEIWNAAARFPAEAPRPNLHRDDAGRDAEQPLGGDRPDGQRDAGSPDRTDGEGRGRDGEPESLESDAVGPENEQHPEPGGGDRTDGTDLQLTDEPEEESEQEVVVLEPSHHDFNTPTGIDYYFHDAEKQELLRTCERLKDHRAGIAAYFAVQADRKERGNFVKGYFNNTFIEQILSNDQRAGYRAYDDALHLWRGAYLSQEREVFMRWEAVADTIYGMILMEEWLDPEERPLPTEGQQIALIEQAQAEKDAAFTLPQAAIDYILAGGSGVSQGKFRIYEQFQKGESAEANAKFLRNEYGTGGHSDAIPGTGIWEDHDNKGITLRKSLSGESQTVVLRWPKVEKRIRELIAADRYLNDAEKAAYPSYLRSREVRTERIRIAEEFRQIIGDYKDYVKDEAKEDKLTDRWYLVSCASSFAMGEKKMFARTGEGDFILPMMREALEIIIADDTPLAERCRDMLAELSGPLAMGLEPTYEELHPPEKEYRISAGDTVYLGAQEYEVVFMGTEQVIVSDVKFPMMQQEYSREDFLRMVAENPINSRYQHIVEEPEQNEADALETLATPAESQEKQYDLGYGYLGNGLTVWNRLEEEHGDYKTVAHIDPDRTITFYEEDMPDTIKEQIRKVAETSNPTISTTQNAPVFQAPAQDAMERAKNLINDFSVAEYSQEANFSNMTKVDLAYTQREDDLAELQVSVDLENFRLLQYVDGKLVNSREYDTLDDLISRELEHLDFNELISDIPDGPAFIDHFYVAPDLEVRGQLDVRRFGTFEEAYAAYAALPTDKVKALGVQNTNPMPGSLDLIQCRDGADVLVEDYLHVVGWNNPEIVGIVQMIQERLSPKREDAPVQQSPEDVPPLRHGTGRTRVERNYRAFAEQFPEIVSGEYRYLQLRAGEDSGYMPLTIERIAEDEISVAHTYTQDGDLMYDPEMTFRIDHEARTLEPLTFRQDGSLPIYQQVYPAPGRWIPKLRNDLSAFADQWFKNIAEQGRIRYRAIAVRDGEDVEIHFDEHGQPMLDAASQEPESRVDKMLQQAMLAAELSEQTGQNVFVFEEGSPQPINVLAGERSASQDEQAKAEIAPPPAAKPRGSLTPTLLHPEIPSEKRLDYRIENDNIGVDTPLERFYHNIRAIQLLKKIESEGRLANSIEQGVLAEYVGWGGLPQFFEESNPHYRELKAVLSDDEYTSARESTLTAFFTPPVVIRAMYQALENVGFKSGNLLEPSCGVGNFMGMKPENLSDSRIYGVELDSISGRIAQQLYQTSSIAVQGFEKTDLPDSFFDVAIGNIPFGNFKLVDSRYSKHNFLIHDYFFAKALDKVRPGGIIAFVTSKGTMDKESPAVRKYIAQRADLLGAIRLPNDTFKSAAGTDVTSDILFFQKRDTLTVEEPAWVYLNTDENGLKMNQYFIDNPDMVLGEMREISGPFGPETACLPFEGQDLGDLLSSAVQNITGSITEYDMDDLADEEEDSSIPADPSVRNFSYTVVDGQVFYRENSRMVPVDLSVTAANRVKGLIGIRDAVRMLIEYQTEDYADTMIAAKQQELNELYDVFSQKYGIINSRANKLAFRADNSFFLLSSLEVLDDEGNFVRKADMFTKRTIRQRVEIAHVDTATEALAISLAEKAKVDMDFMAGLTGKTEEELFSDLKGVVFLNPLYGYGGNAEQKYLPADEYLSGNVREKLAWARRSAELSPEDYGPNVEALEAVQPKDLTAAEISVRIGATWISPEDYADFMFELFDTPNYCQWNIKVHFSEYTGEWNIEGKSYDRSNVKAQSTYGTSRINGYKIMEQTLNLKDVRIFDYIEDEEGKKKPVLNKKETAIAQAKQEQIKQTFQDWIWKDQSRRERLCKLYNEKFNAIRPREYDGSHLTLPGMNPEITLRSHQLNAVARGLYGGNELLGHVVGAGKTFTMVAIAQESKRLGLCQKSLIVVPNHLTEQWATEYLQLYPSANILVATAKDFEAKNRKRFCGRIATGEYDAIIIGHSQLEKIPLSFGRQVYYLEQQRQEILDGIEEMKRNKGDKFSIKQLERTKKQVEAKLDKLNDQSRKDDVVTFEELGIDRLFIDEAHYYKNLAAFSKMRNVGGISQTEAQKSSDLYMKIRYLDELTEGRGVCFATGTPISNTMVEMYTMQKYLQYDTLRRHGMIHFDCWASTFGETVTAIELAPEGTGYRAKTRFARFFNLPELMAMFKEVADIQTADMLSLPVPKANFHTVTLKPSEFQVEMVKELAERAEKVRNGMVNSSQDNMLVITNDGRKLALDQRLINPMLPASDTGKVAACSRNVFEIWQRTAEQRSTQMIFCDLSTPHNDGKFNVYDAIRDNLVAMGIPAEEIAYIHSASTEVKKKELFGKVRSGQIRVLLGSTQKMGAGTNVQRKLIAVHHCDCPWRPADLQQREGRIIRQGNENPEVEIYTYVTEGTFDAYLYQLVESKQKFIGQIMTSKSPVRSAEDIDETALSYAEIKALCSGNPAVKEKMDLDVAVAKLKLLKANHLSQIYSLEHDITHRYPRQIKEAEQMIEGYQQDIAHRDKNTKPNADGFSPMAIQGETFTEKKTAGSALLEECHNMKSPDPVPLGQYRGFVMELYFETASKEFRLTLSHTLRHTVSLGTDIHGNIQRIDNVLDGLEARMQGQQESLKHVESQLETAKEEAQRPFPQEAELKEKQARLDQLNIELNMDQRDNDLVDDDRNDDTPADRENKCFER